MAGKFLDRKIQFFEHRRMNLFRLPALATGAPEELDCTSKQQQVGLRLRNYWTLSVENSTALPSPLLRKSASLSNCRATPEGLTRPFETCFDLYRFISF
jgi:hypothetical protein